MYVKILCQIDQLSTLHCKKAKLNYLKIREKKERTKNKKKKYDFDLLRAFGAYTKIHET